MQVHPDLKSIVIRSRMAALEAEAGASRMAPRRRRANGTHVVARQPSIRWRIGHQLMAFGAMIADVALEVRRPTSTDPCTTVGRLY